MKIEQFKPNEAGFYTDKKKVTWKWNPLKGRWVKWPSKAD
jgi:hypothetical protein